jgi:hypothetical protein
MHSPMLLVPFPFPFIFFPFLLSFDLHLALHHFPCTPSLFTITLQTFLIHLIHLTYFHLLIKIPFFSQLISEVFKSGFSRIPVYGRDQSDILGLLHTKDLIFLDPAVSYRMECTVT